MNCLNNGKTTLFEIKTRWSQDIPKNVKGTYAGNFAALLTLMKMNAKVYLIIVARDTGKIIMGNITSATLRGNKNWLYSLQEGFDWGSPSSYVNCDNGMFKVPVNMTPISEILNQTFLEEVMNKSIERVEEYIKIKENEK